MPPPTPSSPARKPDKRPVNKNVSIRMINQNTFLLSVLCSKPVELKVKEIHI